MANGRIKIANNIEQVAQDIINYIFPYLKTPAEKKRHRNQLSGIFQKVWEDYQKPLIDYPGLAYIERHYINPYFRTRKDEIEATGKIIEESEDNERHIILQAITIMLENGNCESTSANTILLDLLIKQLDKYEPITEDARLAGNRLKAYGSHVGIRETLRDAFVKKAKQIMENWEKEKRVKIIIPVESVQEERAIQPLKLDPAFLEQLSLFRTGKSLSTIPRQRLKNETIAGIKSVEREEIVNPEQTTWTNNKKTIGYIDEYKPKQKEERTVNKLDLSKLSPVVNRLNAINLKKATVKDPELAGISLPPPPPPMGRRKIGKLHQKPMFVEAMRMLENHLKDKAGSREEATPSLKMSK